MKEKKEENSIKKENLENCTIKSIQKFITWEIQVSIYKLRSSGHLGTSYWSSRTFQIHKSGV